MSLEAQTRTNEAKTLGLSGSTYVRFAFAVDSFFVIEQVLDGFDILFRDSVEESVFGLDSVLDEQFDHFQVFVVDGHEQAGTTQRIHAVDVDVARVPRFLQHPINGNETIESYNNQVLVYSIDSLISFVQLVTIWM